jgi:hypothetical protein
MPVSASAVGREPNLKCRLARGTSRSGPKRTFDAKYGEGRVLGGGSGGREPPSKDFVRQRSKDVIARVGLERWVVLLRWGSYCDGVPFSGG